MIEKRFKSSKKDSVCSLFEGPELVLAQANTRPIENRYISKAMKQLASKTGLDHATYHSLHHTSIQEKLKLSGGDIKSSAQRDAGHAVPDMILKVYVHFQDQDRARTAQLFDTVFYKDSSEVDLSILKIKVQDSPDTILQLIEKLIQLK